MTLARRFRRTDGRRGFTFLEVVLVALVMAILLATALPNFSKTAKRLRLERSAFELAHLLRYAHERSVTLGEEVAWVWDTEQRRAHLERVFASGESEPFAERQAVSEPLEKDVSITILRDNDPVERVSFLPDGSSEITVVTVTDEPKQFVISVDGPTSQIAISNGVAAR